MHDIATNRPRVSMNLPTCMGVIQVTALLKNLACMPSPVSLSYTVTQLKLMSSSIKYSIVHVGLTVFLLGQLFTIFVV